MIKGARGFARVATLSEPMKPSIPSLNKLCKCLVIDLQLQISIVGGKKKLSLQKLLGEIRDCLCGKPNEMIIVVYSSPILFCCREWVLNLSALFSQSLRRF